MAPVMDAAAVIAALDLRPHPEGGHYREIHRSEAASGGRAAVTSIYFLLAAGERSHWHRVDATEIWNFHAGAPLELELAPTEGGPVRRSVLGADLAQGHRPQGIVPPAWWQAARSLGAWTLVGCQVAPGFEFTGFELAPPGWRPSAG